MPDLDESAVEAILATVHVPMLFEMARRGTPFRGFLYAGLILTAAGSRLLECNVRLGDPEAQVVLPRVAGDLAGLLGAAAQGRMATGARQVLTTTDEAAVGIVLAAEGYPGDPRRGDPIEGIETARGQGALVFHAGTVKRPGGGFGTNGGRVLTVVGRGPSLADARDASERAADAISWGGIQRRHDIASDLPEPARLVGAGR